MAIKTACLPLLPFSVSLSVVAFDVMSFPSLNNSFPSWRGLDLYIYFYTIPLFYLREGRLAFAFCLWHAAFCILELFISKTFSHLLLPLQACVSLLLNFLCGILLDQVGGVEGQGLRADLEATVVPWTSSTTTYHRG